MNDNSQVEKLTIQNRNAHSLSRNISERHNLWIGVFNNLKS